MMETAGAVPTRVPLCEPCLREGERRRCTHACGASRASVAREMLGASGTRLASCLHGARKHDGPTGAVMTSDLRVHSGPRPALYEPGSLAFDGGDWRPWLLSVNLPAGEEDSE